MLIDISYFTKGPRHIQNASTNALPSMESQSVNKAIMGYMDYCIEPYLHNMVGSELTAQILERLKAIEDGVVDVSPIDSLIERMKESFADFVFFQIAKHANSQATITGVVKLKSANEHVNPKELLVSTWNHMVEANELFLEWVLSDDCPYKVKIRKSMLTPINALNV